MSGLFGGVWQQEYFNVDRLDLREALLDAYGAPITDSEAIIATSSSDVPYLSLDEATDAQQQVDEAVKSILTELGLHTNSANQPIHDPINVNYRGQSVETPIDRTVILTIDDRCLCSAKLTQKLATILNSDLPLWRIHVYPDWDVDCGILIHADETIHGAHGVMNPDSINSWFLTCINSWTQSIGVRCSQFADLQKRYNLSTDASSIPSIVATYASYQGDPDYYSLWIRSKGRLSDCYIIDPDDVGSVGWYYVQKDGQFGRYKGLADTDEPILVREWCAPRRELSHVTVRSQGNDYVVATGEVIRDGALSG